MNEAETRAELIDPALAAAGWGVVEGSRIRREFPITRGRIEGYGKRGKPLTADYVLEYRNTKLAVVEAKVRGDALTKGVAQGKDYAGKLAIRHTYATNGLGIYYIDMQTGKEGEVAAYPTPDELWALTFAAANAWRDRFASVPFEDKGGSHPSRYYQDIAVERVMQAIANGRQRILLTLATGTGKTFIAFQIAWKLFHARWNLSREPARRPRILFLADRNILANQAFNAFSAFAEDALVRIAPEDIRKKGKVPKNGSLFFTIFQTFMTGPPKDGQPSPYFGEYPPDFFDFIVVDECHRGGANDESNWRGILEYFKPAVQLGLTATPKRDENVDTYRYFGDPVYIYSLKDGINDGFLTPFKVKQIQTTLDEYVYTADDAVIEGEIEQGKRYAEADFNRIIEIKQREEYRVRLFMEQVNQNEKTLVFCASQPHALAVRDLINQMKASRDPNYCQRVTADDGELGEQHLRDFQDNEKTTPTILTTSQKLSTGVDARNIRNIVLMRPIRRIIEFKQIIGRGTRLYDGKDYFTIYDFVKAHQHFSDPEWDGEPAAPEPVGDPKPLTIREPREDWHAQFSVVRRHPLAVVRVPARLHLVDQVAHGQGMHLARAEHQRLLVLVDLLHKEPHAVLFALLDLDDAVEVRLRVPLTLLDLAFNHRVVRRIHILVQGGLDLLDLKGRQETIVDAVFERVNIDRVTEVAVGVHVLTSLGRGGQAELHGRLEIFQDAAPIAFVVGATAMAFIHDDEVEKVRRILAEVRRRLAILGWAAHEGLEDGEEQAAVLRHFAFLADVLGRNAHKRIFGECGEGVEGLIRQYVPVRKEQNARAARRFTAQVPAGVKQLPRNLKGDECLARAGGQSKQDALPVICNGLHHALDSDVLVIPARM